MMTRTDNKQIKFHMITIENLVPEDHFMRKLNRLVDFSFIYLDQKNRHRFRFETNDGSLFNSVCIYLHRNYHNWCKSEYACLETPYLQGLILHIRHQCHMS